jgi:hypothetical protein
LRSGGIFPSRRFGFGPGVTFRFQREAPLGGECVLVDLVLIRHDY